MAAVTAQALTSAVAKSAFVGKSVRSVKAAAATRKVAFTVRAERPLYFPGNPAPAHLDGSLAGDFGFDPLGLATTNLDWYVQAELVHSRWAMLGAAGILITDVLRTAGVLDIPRWDAAGVADYAIDTPTLILIELVLVGYAEGKRWADINNPGSVNEDPIFKGNKVTGTDVGYPGFDPLGLGSGSADAVKEVRLKEIKNGRLAMLAVLGFAVQAAYTDASPTENLLAHLADPFHNNLIESLFGAGINLA